VKRLFLLICAFVAMPAWAQQDFSKVEIKAEKLSDTVYMLTGAAGALIVAHENVRKRTAEFDEVWGKGFLNPQRFTEMPYKSAAKK